MTLTKITLWCGVAMTTAQIYEKILGQTYSEDHLTVKNIELLEDVIDMYLEGNEIRRKGQISIESFCNDKEKMRKRANKFRKLGLQISRIPHDQMEDVYGVNEEIDTLFIVGRRFDAPVAMIDVGVDFGSFKVGQPPQLHVIQNDCCCCS